MNQNERKYKTFINGHLKRNNNKNYFDPIAIKIDTKTFTYEEALKS